MVMVRLILHNYRCILFRETSKKINNVPRLAGFNIFFMRNTQKVATPKLNVKQ